MAITHVQDLTPAADSTSGGVTSIPCSFPSATTAGDALVLVIGTTYTGVTTDAVTGISDGGGNSWISVVAEGNGACMVSTWWSRSTASAGTITISLRSSLNVAVVGAEFSGILEVSNFNAASGTSTSPASGSVSTTGVVLAVGGTSYTFPYNGSATSYTPTSGWTTIGTAASSDTHHGDTNVAVAADYNPSVSSSTQDAPTLGTSESWTCSIAIFTSPVTQIPPLLETRSYLQAVNRAGTY